MWLVVCVYVVKPRLPATQSEWAGKYRKLYLGEIVMMRSVLILVIVLVSACQGPQSLVQSQEGCPYRWQGNPEAPQHLVDEYIEAKCALWETVQGTDAADIVAAQQEYAEVLEAIYGSKLPLIPEHVADLDTVQRWLEMRAMSSDVPGDYSLTEGEPKCPFPDDRETCEPRFTLVADGVSATIAGGRIQQRYGTFTVYRSCEDEIDPEQIEQAFSCTVTWITEYRDPEQRGLNELAMINYDWKVIGRE